MARAVIQLEMPTSGSVFFQGRAAGGCAFGTCCGVLDGDMSMVFQDPYGSLNPRMRAGNIVGEPLRAHHGCSGRMNEYRDRVARIVPDGGDCTRELQAVIRISFRVGSVRGSRLRVRWLRIRSWYLLDEPVSASGCFDSGAGH